MMQLISTNFRAILPPPEVLNRIIVSSGDEVSLALYA